MKKIIIAVVLVVVLLAGGLSIVSLHRYETMCHALFCAVFLHSGLNGLWPLVRRATPWFASRYGSMHTTGR